MSRTRTITHRFVENIPETVAEGTLYVSIRNVTAIHNCFCGCGEEVVTPISPTDWTLIFDGDTVSLKPSIGNWSLPCRSHYWISKNRVMWAKAWTQEAIDAAREAERQSKAEYVATPKSWARVSRKAVAIPVGQ